MSRHDEIARNDGERTWDRDDGNRQAFRPVHNDESCFVRDNKLIAVFRSSFSNRLD